MQFLISREPQDLVFELGVETEDVLMISSTLGNHYVGLSIEFDR